MAVTLTPKHLQVIWQALGSDKWSIFPALGEWTPYWKHWFYMSSTIKQLGANQNNPIQSAKAGYQRIDFTISDRLKTNTTVYMRNAIASTTQPEDPSSGTDLGNVDINVGASAGGSAPWTVSVFCKNTLSSAKVTTYFQKIANNPQNVYNSQYQPVKVSGEYSRLETLRVVRLNDLSENRKPSYISRPQGR